MWTCTVCAREIEAEESFCYHCGASRETSGVDAARIAEKREGPAPLACSRCANPMRFTGTRKFHEGTRGWGFWLGDLGELFTNREHYDTYVCTRCGKIEFFLEGLGEEHRGTESGQVT